MSLLIKGMEMPDINDYNGISCCLYKALGGQLRLRNNETGQFFDVVPVPPHGDLIDRDALPWEKQSLMEADEGWALPCVLIEDAPTIIPEEKKA